MAQVAHSYLRVGRDILVDQIRRALDAMPPDLREVFVLTHYEGRSFRSVAESLHLNPSELALKVGKANEVFFRSLRTSVDKF